MTQMAGFEHMPVLLREAVDFLACRTGGIYVDCTVGGGGHAAAIAARIGPDGRLIALDRDPVALAAARERLAQYDEMVTLVQANFSDLTRALAQMGISQVDGVLFDLGVSSPQLDEPERGFSYQVDAPLDMRMDPGTTRTAADLVNRLREGELARVIAEYGEERWAGRIAKFIAARRAERPIMRTGELVEIIKDAIPAAARRSGPHPARRTFQALRIAVNDELESVERGLAAAVAALATGGRVGVIAFHSLEDRLVKRTFQRMEKPCECPPGLPVCACGKRPLLRVITRKPVTPSEMETVTNPRARSARLRVAEKLPG